MPIVSIVVATRNRPQKLERLLCCIQQQQLTDYECIIVDDGSSKETWSVYKSLFEKLDSRFVLHCRDYSGGPAQSRNTGIIASSGKYIAFCDDDDYWTRPDHLEVAVRTLEREAGDFFFANMQTSINGEVKDPDWFKILKKTINQPAEGESDVYPIDKDQLAFFLKHRVHHANTIVVTRDLLIKINSYWEKVSFAEDHDFSFRLSDAAKRVFFRTAVTADLDVTTHPSIARTFSVQDRFFFSILATIHAEAAIESPLLRKVARGNRAWRFLELAQHLEKGGQVDTAYEFIWQSFILSPSFSAFKILFKLYCIKLVSRKDKIQGAMPGPMRDKEDYSAHEIPIEVTVSEEKVAPLSYGDVVTATNASGASTVIAANVKGSQYLLEKNAP